MDSRSIFDVVSVLLRSPVTFGAFHAHMFDCYNLAGGNLDAFVYDTKATTT